MVFPNPVEQAFHMKMIFHDSIEEQEIMIQFLLLLQFFSLTHKFKGLKSSRSHVLGMKSYIDRLRMMGSVVCEEMAIDWVLQSLPNSYCEFVREYYMMKLDVTLIDLTYMLIAAESAMFGAIEKQS